VVPAQVQPAIFRPDVLQRRQVINVILQLVQQGWFARFTMGGENVDLLVRGFEPVPVFLGIVEFVQQADVVPALFAPGRQQRIGVLVQLVRIGNLRQFRVSDTPFAFGLQQFPVTDDVGPVILAGVVDAQHHLAESAEYVQCFQGLTRQRGDAEHHDPRWQARAVRRR